MGLQKHALNFLENITAKISGVPINAQLAVPSFQDRVDPWLMECFGEKIARNRRQRNHRFLEEALELVQATGSTHSEVIQLVNYVYGRDIGEPHQEVGGVMVTLAALCLAHDLDMHANGETELARVWTKIEKIRAKHYAKPNFSPLPQDATNPFTSTADVLAAIDPVLHWYQADDQPDRRIEDILRDIVADLESDRAELISLRASSAPSCPPPAPFAETNPQPVQNVMPDPSHAPESVPSIREFFKGLDEKPQKGLTARELVSINYVQILRAKKKGYTYADIAQIIVDAGVQISPNTLGRYVREHVPAKRGRGKTGNRRVNVGVALT